ncbi:alkaline phosphatase [Parabacteroides sp. 52]|uniref:alkaline phosphatase n=1 Tax=unclassified Parabacteroides TaxID=2649774 RepID=UPI0013D4B593|nr:MULTISPECIES: alkaline phosphatase [unclassified Parabacteroides]MDH6533857.1 putative AlkP superfamily pyrophosphatase or phosphodiesterase [Parabacteroides sp. PM5-20]NDV54603.1 alkaline phosphatase [Parabacteroides sp. 52]
MKKTFLLAVYALLIGCLAACSTTPSQTPEKKKNLPKHVILVGFDGWSSHSLNNGADMPTVRQLMAEGSSDLKSRSVLPSSSAVNWASMFMGAGPELHGYTEWGSRVPELPSRVLNSVGRFPNIFGLFRDKAPEAEIGYIYEWGGINYLADTLAMSYKQQVAMNEENPDGCTPFAVKYIKEKKPNLLAVIYDQPDGTGHKYGWTSPEYYAKINHLDKCLAQIIEAVKEAGILDETVIIVTSDHGGIDKGHGGKTMNEMERPLVIYGKGIKKGHTIPESTMIYDIAGTMAYLLDVEQPQVWIARPVLSIFE